MYAVKGKDARTYHILVVILVVLIESLSHFLSLLAVLVALGQVLFLLNDFVGNGFPVEKLTILIKAIIKDFRGKRDVIESGRDT